MNLSPCNQNDSMISTLLVNNFSQKWLLKPKQKNSFSVILIKPRIFSNLYTSVITVRQLVLAT